MIVVGQLQFRCSLRFVCDCAVDADVPLSDMLKTFN